VLKLKKFKKYDIEWYIRDIASPIFSIFVLQISNPLTLTPFLTTTTNPFENSCELGFVENLVKNVVKIGLSYNYYSIF
jgi:hypothetical protein